MVFASMAPRDFDNQDRQKYPASGKARSNSIDSCDSNEPETIDDEPSPPIVEDAVSTSAPIQSQMHYAETDSSPLKRSREEVSGPFTIESIEMNKQYDVLDSTNRWCEAEVIKLDREGRRAYVTYIYWSSKYDEWITDIEGRFAALHAHTYHEGGVLKVGQRIEVKDEQNKWLESYVIEENENQIKVHFKGFHQKFDTWLDRTDRERIRPYGRNNFFVQRKKNAVQWSARPYMLPMDPGSSTQHSFELVNRYPSDNKENIASLKGQPAVDQQRVRYIGDDGRNRKIANNSVQFLHYQSALQRQGLELVPVSGDGNCLFRSVAHQIYGNEELHDLVRQKCMDYMESEADFFSQFVVGGKETFHLYLQAKRMNGCWGDDPEIEAMCEIYNRPAEIWAYDPHQGAKKLRTFHETVGMMNARRGASSSSSTFSMRLSYYGGGHYDSVVDSRLLQSFSSISKRPGEIEAAAIERSRNRWMMAHSQLSVESVRQLTDVAATEQASLDIALQESRRLQMDSEYDDLETTLMMSIQDFNATAPANSNQMSSMNQNGNDIGNRNSSNGVATASTNEIARIAAQDNIIETVQRQSENEYLESILLSSMVNESKVDTAPTAQDEELLLQQAILQSQLESSVVSGKNNSVAVDKDMQLALELSSLSPEEALQLALQKSIAESSTIQPTVPVPPVPSSVPSPLQPQPSTASTDHMTEDEMLQLALAASLQSAPVGQSSHSNASNLGYFADEEYDEDLMLAIQASLGK